MNNTEEKDVPSISIRLEMGKHKKGAPYPEYDFTGVDHVATKSESVATSNEAVKDQIHRFFNNNPDTTEATYFYFQLSEPIRAMTMRHTKAFELIMTHLHEESGDGDAHIICKYLPKEEMADKFEAYLSIENEYTKFNRLKRCPYDPEDKTILFSDMSNENVCFSDEKDNVEYASWVGLVIKL